MQTSQTKRTLADTQEKVLHDATAGSMATPLRISGASLAGNFLYTVMHATAGGHIAAAARNQHSLLAGEDTFTVVQIAKL